MSYAPFLEFVLFWLHAAILKINFYTAKKIVIIFKKEVFSHFTPHLSLYMAANPINTGLMPSEGYISPLTHLSLTTPLTPHSTCRSLRSKVKSFFRFGFRNIPTGADSWSDKHVPGVRLERGNYCKEWGGEWGGEWGVSERLVRG